MGSFFYCFVCLNVHRSVYESIFDLISRKRKFAKENFLLFLVTFLFFSFIISLSLPLRIWIFIAVLTLNTWRINANVIRRMTAHRKQQEVYSKNLWNVIDSLKPTKLFISSLNSKLQYKWKFFHWKYINITLDLYFFKQFINRMCYKTLHYYLNVLFC